MTELDPHVHQPTRLRLLMLLSGVESADFVFLLTTLGLTKGNLSSHMTRLEQAGYIEVSKGFDGKIPHTAYRLTPRGRSSLDAYWRALDEIRRSPRRIMDKKPARPPGLSGVEG
jgi:DNA-binding MarR family transcriptional regulator